MTDAPLRTHRFDALQPGPRLIVIGGVHGNETCGTVAIRRLVEALDRGEVRLARGVLTLLPVANPMAHALGRREGDRNLNRMLRPTAIPRDHEDRIANRLCPLLDAHDVVLDLHSFHTGGEPFTMLGPLDNDDAIEPFAHAAQEQAFAACLGPRRIVEGWLDTYARGVQARRARDAGSALGDPEYGVGTTEYMRSRGGYGVTLECGQHDDPAAPEVAWHAIGQALAHLRMVDRPPAPTPGPLQVLRLDEVVDRLHAADRFARPWTSFDPVHAGQPIGLRHDGAPVVAPADGHVVFPNPNAAVGQEWFYFARPSERRIG